MTERPQDAWLVPDNVIRKTLMFTVIGEALIDLVEDPDGRFTAHPGGSPLNVAVGLARLGHRTHFRTRFSDSAFGRRLRAHAVANDVDIRHAPDATEPAGLAVVAVDPDGGAAYDFYVDGAADWQWHPGDLTHFPPGTQAVHAGSLAAFLDPGAVAVEAALSAARSAGHLVSVDPNIRPRLLGSRDSTVVRLERLLAYAQIVKASDADLDWLYPGVTPADIASHWIEAGPELVVITRGGEGAFAMTAHGVIERPALRVQVVDTVGAGDAFTAALLSALTSEMALPDALDFAMKVAAVTCTRAGADPPVRAELV